MFQYGSFCLFLLLLPLPLFNALQIVAPSTFNNLKKDRFSRRTFGHAATVSLIPFLIASSAGATGATSNDTIRLRINSPDEKVGLELYDVTIGMTPAVAVKRVVQPSKANIRIQPGMILLPNGVRTNNSDSPASFSFVSAAQVQRRLRSGPFPVELVFRNLAAGGDALSDLGTPLVSAQDALDLAVKTSEGTATNAALSTPQFSITTLNRPDHCTLQSRRNDLLEINYEARVHSTDGRTYDSSATRGTGQPYQMVLGSGDMLPGVDQGLYDMCPGEIRILQIPPALAYGSRGNRLFQIPPDATLVWHVELVAINSVRQGDPRTRDDVEGRFAYD